MTSSGGFWNFRISLGDAYLEVEVDGIALVACVLDKKNLGYKSISKFMTALMDELEHTDIGEDPRPVES
jgi:hypothetical protein